MCTCPLKVYLCSPRMNNKYFLPSAPKFPFIPLSHTHALLVGTYLGFFRVLSDFSWPARSSSTAAAIRKNTKIETSLTLKLT